MRLIDAHRVLDEIDRLITKEVEQNYVNSAYYALKFVRTLIDDYESDENATVHNYCPNCGAKMDKEDIQ